MTAFDAYSGASTFGFEALLFLADIALAVGAKMEVRASLLKEEKYWSMIHEYNS